MDQLLRDLQRKYLASPDANTLCQILTYYARINDIPSGDFQALELLNYNDIKKRGVPALDPNAGWARQFDIQQINNLVGLGYPIGVYAEVTASIPGTYDGEAPSTLQVTTDADYIYKDLINQIVSILNRLGSTPIQDLDSINHLDVGPGNAYARQILEDEQPRWQKNLELAQQNRAQSSNLRAEIQLFSKPPQIVEKKRKPIRFKAQIFIPAIALDKAYALEITSHRQGMSRSTVRMRASDTIDWGTPNQAGPLKSTFGQQLKSGRFSASLTRFDYNLLLALSNYFKFRKGWIDE